MRVDAVLFWCLTSTALTTAAGMAHLYELPNKLRLNWQDYLTVQQIYRGWSLLRIAAIASVVLNLMLAYKLWDDGRAFPLAFSAFLCMLASQVVFWVYNFPVNQTTKNWTVVPAQWLRLRTRWEYSHAAAAILDLAGLILLFLVALSRWK